MEVIRKELDVEYERMRGAPMPPNPRERVCVPRPG